MTLIDPILGTPAQVPPLDGFGYAPFPDAQPFSQRTASGYQESLEYIIMYLQRKLIPYLRLTNSQGQWDANATALVAAVDVALEEQTTDNAQRIADALDALIHSSITITDPAILVVLQKADSATRVWLDGAYASKSSFDTLKGRVDSLTAFIAPPPSGDTTGATDQAALAPLLAAAQANGGKLVLQAGDYYVTGLATTGAFQQPRIVGAGMKYTRIHGVTVGGTAIRLKGGSGQANGGGVDDCTISNPGGIALQLADVTSTTHHNVRLTDAQEGVEFLSESSNAFCEFNVCYDFDIASTVVLPIRYKKTSGNESFHGSGFGGAGTVINQGGSTTGPIVQIEPGCLPYQAPMNFTVFPRSVASALISNLNLADNGRRPEFHGHIKIESGSLANVVFGSGGFYWVGDVPEMFGANGYSKGDVTFCDASYYSPAGIFHLPKKTRFYSGDVNGIGNSPGFICPLLTGAGHLIDVYLVAPNYMRRYLLWVTQNPTTNGGNVTVLAEQSIDNTAGYGAAAFTISGYQLFATISGAPANASSPVRATTVRTITGVHAGFPNIF